MRKVDSSGRVRIESFGNNFELRGTSTPHLPVCVLLLRSSLPLHGVVHTIEKTSVLQLHLLLRQPLPHT